MAEAVLKEARSKHYSYAAKDVLSAGQIAEAVTDWKGHGDHAAFVNRLRQQHGRKSAFWPLLEEKLRWTPVLRQVAMRGSCSYKRLRNRSSQ